MNYDILSPKELKNEKERLQDLYAFTALNKEEETDFETIINLSLAISKKRIAFISFNNIKHSYFKKIKKQIDLNQKAFTQFQKNFPKKNEYIQINDTTLDKRCKNDILVTGKAGIKFYASNPINLKNKTFAGNLCIFDIKTGKLSAQQIKQLQSLCILLGSFIEIREQKVQLELLNSGLLNALKLQINEQNKVLNLFSRFVPPAIVKRHLKSTDGNFDDAELKTVTVLFCDIRGYTPLVENLDPSQAVAILKLYYTTMSEQIHSHGGMVNQYVGDEIFAIFGDPFTKPPYGLRAVECAISMMDKIKDINKQVNKIIKGKIQVGIGIHSGPVITCTLGSKEKIEYSVTGDTVNTGKRIESHTQTEPGTILISEQVNDQIKNIVNVIKKEPIIVKGKSKPIQVYQVVLKNKSNKQKAK